MATSTPAVPSDVGLEEWRTFCTRHGRRAARQRELADAATRPPIGPRPAMQGGLARTADWLGGVDPGSAEQVALWSATLEQAVASRASVVWIAYKTERLLRRNAERVIVGIEEVPVPLDFGVAELPTLNDPIPPVDGIPEQRGGFWCGAWTEDAAALLAYLRGVAETLTLPESILQAEPNDAG